MYGKYVKGEYVIDTDIPSDELSDSEGIHTADGVERAIAHPHDSETDFVPTFSPRTRTIVYVVCMVMGIVSYVLTVTTSAIDAPVWLTVACATCTAVPGYVAAAFGVHYDGISIRK